MKRKLGTILLVMALAVSFGVVPAASVNADGALPSLVWLPPLANQGEFQLKDGSTLPIKFTLNDPATGAFVPDTGVHVDVNEVLISDDFGSYLPGANGAPVWTPVTDNWSVESDIQADGSTGQVYSQNNTDGTAVVRWSLAGDANWTDYVFEAKVKGIEGHYPGYGANTWNGLVFRAVDNNHFYEYYFRTCSQDIMVVKHDGAIRTVVSGPVYFPCQNGVWYKLKVVAEGNSFRFYADDVELSGLAFTDYYSFAKGRVGVYVWDGSHTHFDDVMALEMPAAKTFSYGSGSDNVRLSCDTIFSDTFSASDGTQPDNPWDVISGTWLAAGYEYQQTENLYMPNARSFAGDVSWTNYTMTAKVKVSDDGWGGILLRANADGDTYYELYLQSGGRLQLVKTVGGARTGVTNPYVGTFADQWWYVKAFVNGSNIKGKAWPASGPEPTTWRIDWNDPVSPISNGRIGLVTFSQSPEQLPVFFDDVTVQVYTHYIAILHTKDSGMTLGNYLITVWSGSGDQLGAYLVDLTESTQGIGRGKGKA